MEDYETGNLCSICGAENAFLHGEDEYLCENCYEIVCMIQGDVDYFEDLTGESI